MKDRLSNSFQWLSLRLPVLLLALLPPLGCIPNEWPPASPPLVWPNGMRSNGGAVEASPSPDGRRLLYSAWNKNPDGTHIFVSKADGTEAKQLTAQPSADFSCAWSPDGMKIIFVRAARLRPYSMGGMIWDNDDIWTVNVDGTDERRLTNEKFYSAGSPHFSPDQSRVVFWATRNSQDEEASDDDVVIGDFDKSGNLTTFKWMPKAPGPGGVHLAANGDPSFSPSGDAIVFISNRVSRPSPYDYEVWITDPSFSQTVQLTHLQARLAAPTFTSDGVYILFTEWSSEPRLWRMKRDGSELTRLH